MSDLLPVVARLSLAVSAACCVLLVLDVLRHPQRMWIMNVVWPVTALYSGPIGLWMYWRLGRKASAQTERKGRPEPSMWQATAVATTHCGSGCTLGDLIAEALLVFGVFSFHLFGRTIFASWVVDYGFALLLGIAFQYFTIQPMRQLSVKRGMLQAVKADFLSLTSWQLGMYGWMAFATFGIFGHELQKNGPLFWFMMQIAMLLGFVTSYPVNWLLVARGIKEKM